MRRITMLIERRVFRRAAASVLLLFTTAQVTSCFSERAPTDPLVLPDDCAVPGEAIGPNRTVIALRSYTFLPDTIRVRAGTTVYWVNCDNVAELDAHTTTSDAGEWDSPPFVEGQFYQRAFPTAGVYDYHCVPHSFMRGTVIVE